MVETNYHDELVFRHRLRFVNFFFLSCHNKRPPMIQILSQKTFVTYRQLCILQTFLHSLRDAYSNKTSGEISQCSAFLSFLPSVIDPYPPPILSFLPKKYLQSIRLDNTRLSTYHSRKRRRDLLPAVPCLVFSVVVISVLLPFDRDPIAVDGFTGGVGYCAPEFDAIGQII